MSGANTLGLSLLHSFAADLMISILSAPALTMDEVARLSFPDDGQITELSNDDSVIVASHGFAYVGTCWIETLDVRQHNGDVKVIARARAWIETIRGLHDFIGRGLKRKLNSG
jgi:hypothetical protein